jgi:hypothetical protein
VFRPSRVRAALVGGIAAVLIASGLIVAAKTASSSPNLAPVAPDRLIASMLLAMERHPQLSGHVATHVDLGLPQLPTLGPDASSGMAAVLSAINGDHSLRVWRSDGSLRLSESLEFGERSLIVTPEDAWAWDSGLYTAYHLGPLPSATGFPGRDAPSHADMLDPLSLARRALGAIDASTAVSLGRPARVAGRGAYVLVLAPRTDQTLIGRVEISVDAVRRLPLRVAVFARGARSPSASVGYTSVGFGPVDPAVFRFNPPPGAKVVPGQDLFASQRDGANGTRAEPGDEYTGYPGGGAPIRTFGRGWATIIALRTASLANHLGKSAGIDLSSFLPFSGPLFSIRLVTRGDHDWVVYGFVPQPALAAVEQELT